MRRVHPGRGLPAEGRRRRGETTVVFGKPRETVGQQNYGTKVKGSFPMLCSPGCNFANLQIHVKPQNEKSWKGFSKGKKGMTNQAGQRGIFANRLSRTIISG